MSGFLLTRKRNNASDLRASAVCQLSVGLVPLILQMEGNRPKGIAVALMAPVGLAVTSLGALS